MEYCKKEILIEDLPNKIVYVSLERLKAKQTVKTWKHAYKVPDDFEQAWFFFVR